MGTILTYVHGKIMAQLRQEKRQKRHVSPDKENRHLKLSIVDRESSIVTLYRSNGSPKPKRWYNNGLWDGDSIISPIISTLSFTENVSLKRSEELNNKVLRCLVDGTSPTSEMKKSTFNAIITSKIGVKKILAISSELVCADIAETVNTCKHTLMDNVL